MPEPSSKTGSSTRAANPSETNTGTPPSVAPRAAPVNPVAASDSRAAASDMPMGVALRRPRPARAER